jgi:glycosyltransferase involved in cell wall biosynthesis
MMADDQSTPWGGVDGQDCAPSDPIRVLMVLDSFSFGGAENLVVELAKHAPKALDVSVASLVPAEAERSAFLDRFIQAGLNPTFLSVRRLLDPVGFLQLVRALRHAPVDVVHAHLEYSAIMVPLAARLAGKPVVATLHTNPQHQPLRRGWLKERLAVRIPSLLGRLVLVSRHAYDEYARRHGPAHAAWRMIPNGVDLHQYLPRRRLARSIDQPVWAVVAALRPAKGHSDLIRAWAGVVAAHPRATLLVIGDGPARADIEHLVAAAGLQSSVELLGRRDDVPELLQRVDGVVSASTDEALPTALIEAAACGLPIIATDAGGTREIVADSITGRLVPVGDVTALTEALLDTIENPTLAAHYGAAGHQLVKAKYDIATWANQLELLYSEVTIRGRE